MPKIERWENFPEGVRQHLIVRMHDRRISIADLNQLRLWIESGPEVPSEDSYKDFGSFKICGRGGISQEHCCFRAKLQEARLSEAVRNSVQRMSAP